MKNLETTSSCALAHVEKGQEWYEVFVERDRRARTFVQYDFRTEEGALFSCVKPTLEMCREARDRWIEKITSKNND